MEYMKLYTNFSVSVGKKAVTDYISFIWTDRYNSCGDFEMIVPYNSSNSRFYKQDMIVTCSKSQKRMIIEKIQISLSPESGSVMKISGRSYESILDRRVVSVPMIITNDTFNENKFLTGLTMIIQSCCGSNNSAVSQFLSSRDDTLNPKSYSQYKVEPNRSLGINGASGADSKITNANINIDATGKTLLEVLEELCQSKDFGFSYNGGSYIDIYCGNANSGIIYSFLNGELSSADYISDKTDYKNTIYIQGEEYTSPEDIVEVDGVEYSLKELEEKGLVAIITPDIDNGNPIYYRAYSTTDPNLSGLARREMYYNSSKEKGKNTDHKYAARLRADGAYELFKHSFKVQAAVQIVNDNRSNAELGDIVRVDTGLSSIEMRVSEKTISHSESGLFIYPVLTGYDPNQTELSNILDTGYDPTEHSDEISEYGYDQVIEVDFLFNGGKIEQAPIMYVEPSGNSDSSNNAASYNGWYILPKQTISPGSFVTISQITGVYNYQEIGDFLTLPTYDIKYDHHTFVAWVKMSTEQRVDEKYVLSKTDPNPLVLKALWKDDIHYVICDPGEYGTYSSGMAVKKGNESYFQEWIEENEKSDEPKFYSWYVSTGSYEGCIVKLYKYGEYPWLPTPNYPHSETVTNPDGSTTTTIITFTGWSPSPVTKVEEHEKRYTAQYEVEIKNGPPPDDPDPDPDPDPPYSNKVEDEPVEMVHFVSRGTNKGCSYSNSPDHPDLLVKTGAGGYDRQEYSYTFEASLLNRDDPTGQPVKCKITYQAHMFSARGAIVKDTDDLITKTWKLYAYYPCGISFILGGDRSLYNHTTMTVTDMPKVTELAISKKPYVFDNYENISLSDKTSLIPFMSYAYGTSNGTIYQRPPSDWKTRWKDYYKINVKAGVKIGFCVNYYDANGNRIDEEWGANGGTKDDQPNLAKTTVIDGKTYYVQEGVVYGTYYEGDVEKKGTNTIYSPYSKMTNYGWQASVNGNAGTYYNDSGWVFKTIKYSDEGRPLNEFTERYECGEPFWMDHPWVIGGASVLYGHRYPWYRSSDEIAIAINYGRDRLYGSAPGASGPSETTTDPIDKLSESGGYDVITIMKTKNCICSPDGRALFIYYGIIPGHELTYQWQVYANFQDGRSPEWLDIPGCNGTRLFVACTAKTVGELWQIGYDGLYATLGTNHSSYRCVVKYTTKKEQEDGTWKEEDVEIVGMEGEIIIDSSSIPTGIEIEDNPDLKEDDRPDKIKDKILDNMSPDDLSNDTKSDIDNTIQSINGNSKPTQGSSTYNYTKDSIKNVYHVSDTTASAIIDRSY